MFENLDRLSQRTHDLAQALVRETPPGQPFDTNSPVYKELHATLLETQEHVKQLEAQAVEQFHKDIADLPPIPEPVPPAAVSVPVPETPAEELPEGTVTFQFERDHVPAEDTIRAQLARLAAMAQVDHHAATSAPPAKSRSSLASGT